MRIALVLMIVLQASRVLADGTALDGVSLDDFNAGEGDTAGSRASEALNAGTELWNQTSSLGAGVAGAMGQIQAAMDMFSALSALDQELSNHTQHQDAPPVPSSCGGDTTGQCAECFQRAYGEVNFTRITLERLRTIVARTLTFIRAAEGFGDSVSGVHGISGLSWQYAKADVEKSKRDFMTSSTAKYEALLQNMHRALDMVAACERDNFHNPDWYTRYGFMYYEFVREAYRPHE